MFRVWKIPGPIVVGGGIFQGPFLMEVGRFLGPFVGKVKY